MPRLSYRRRLMLRKLLRVLGIVLAATIVIGAALLLYLESLSISNAFSSYTELFSSG